MRGSFLAWGIPVRALAVLFTGLLSASAANAVPSFARQTGLACQACHTVFPELTPFGRTFKLNAYTLDNLPQVQGISPTKDYELLLNQVAPLSIMFQTSYTRTSQALPDTSGSGKAQDGQLLFPQQASLFYAGRIAPGLGAFIQMTYASDSGSFGWDNTEFRYAKQFSLASSRLIVGATINNNPTVQDPWNSTPAWQTPFDQRSSAAPTPSAGAQIDGALGGAVAGLTGYLWWNNSVYAEFGLYHSAPQGVGGSQGAGPLDTASNNDTLSSWAPYWRIAYERQWDRNSWSVGAYGIRTRITPAGLVVGSVSNRFNDVALDTQYQFIGDEHLASVQATYIMEHQDLDATFAGGTGSANTSNTLKTFRLGGSYFYQRRFGGALGYFSTTGSADSVLYAPAAVNGSASGSPNSNGWIGELDYLPWQNVKIALQYIAYQKFNGGSTNYDGSGRDASDNNTLYLLGWFAF